MWLSWISNAFHVVRSFGLFFLRNFINIRSAWIDCSCDVSLRPYSSTRIACPREEAIFLQVSFLIMTRSEKFCYRASRSLKSQNLNQVEIWLTFEEKRKSRRVWNGPIQFKCACKMWPLLRLLAKNRRVLACSARARNFFATPRMLEFSLKFRPPWSSSIIFILETQSTLEAMFPVWQNWEI